MTPCEYTVEELQALKGMLTELVGVGYGWQVSDIFRIYIYGPSTILSAAPVGLRPRTSQEVYDFLGQSGIGKRISLYRIGQRIY